MAGSRTVLAVALFSLLFTGCGHDKRAIKTVTSRASFDLSCPKDEIELTVLSTEGARKLAKQIGASGCGRKMVYLYFVSSDAWIADTAVTPALIQYENVYKEQQAREQSDAEQKRRFEHEQNYQRGVVE